MVSKRRLRGSRIGQKLLAGYSVLAVLTVVTAIVALGYLQKLTSVNRAILEEDIPLRDSCEVMSENLYAQELYGQRYLISRNSEMLELFRTKKKDFVSQLKRVEGLITGTGEDAGAIRALHRQYTGTFTEWFGPDRGEEQPTDAEYEDRLATLQDQLITVISRMETSALDNQLKRTLTSSRLASRAFSTIAILCFLSIFFGIGASLIITRNISRAIGRLMAATKKISKGEFQDLPRIRNRDELGELGSAFHRMAVRLRQLEELNLDANPLTHLPGAIAVEAEIKNLLYRKNKFAFALIDIDYFKAYNDYYGYARGNEVIQLTSRIVREAVETQGNADDFIGHIGGDDFVFISTISRFQSICETILSRFDTDIKEMYDSKDRELGYIETRDRNNHIKKFPIMTLSIAVVTNKQRTFQHYVEVSEVAAEIKNYAKSKPHSLYMVDRRGRKKKQP